MTGLKATAKGWIKKASVDSGALRLLNRFGDPSAVILMYHSVQDEPERYADTIGLPNIHATSLFERQVESIVSRYVPVTVEDIRLFLEGEKPLSPRAVALTFDDGYADNFRIAAPVLDRFGIRASFYVTVDYLGKTELPWFCRLRHAFRTTPRSEWPNPHSGQVHKLSSMQERDRAFQAAMSICVQLTGELREEILQSMYKHLSVEPEVTENALMMSWDEVRQLQRAGHIVGSHSLTHPNLAHVGEDVARNEMAGSKRRLEEKLKVPVEHFCYPAAALADSWNERTRIILQETGYRDAVTTTRGSVHPGDNPLSLNRIGAHPQDAGYQFQWDIECTLLGRIA